MEKRILAPLVYSDAPSKVKSGDKENFETVIRIFESHHNISSGELNVRTRKKDIINLRFQLVYFIYVFTRMGAPRIASCFNSAIKNSATVKNAIDKVHWQYTMTKMRDGYLEGFEECMVDMNRSLIVRKHKKNTTSKWERAYQM